MRKKIFVLGCFLAFVLAALALQPQLWMGLFPTNDMLSQQQTLMRWSAGVTIVTIVLWVISLALPKRKIPQAQAEDFSQV
jgi:hypothetical protein